jgi:hypothetical protein
MSKTLNPLHFEDLEPHRFEDLVRQEMFVLWLNRIRFLQESILLVSVVYVLVIFGGGYFIRALIGPLWKEEQGQTTKEHEEVINAGLYIGWLERFLVLTALFL